MKRVSAEWHRGCLGVRARVFGAHIFRGGMKRPCSWVQVGTIPRPGGAGQEDCGRPLTSENAEQRQTVHLPPLTAQRLALP